MKFVHASNLTNQEHDALIGKIYFYAKELPQEKPWQVVFSDIEESKSYKQLKGIHKLCSLARPHLEAWKGCKFNLDDAKKFMKFELDFVRDPLPIEISLMIKSCNLPLNPELKKDLTKQLKHLKQPRSFKDASKEEMIDLITHFEAFAADENKETNKTAWLDVFLRNDEKDQFLKFYDKK